MRHGGRSLLGEKSTLRPPAPPSAAADGSPARTCPGRRDIASAVKNPHDGPAARSATTRRRFQTELVADVVLHGRIDKRKRADRARDLAVADRFFGLQQAFAVALHFLIPQRHFQPERNRFRVNPCDRPIISVLLCSIARLLSTSSSTAICSSRSSAASFN